MCQYKHIERSIGEYIAARYRRAVEVGIGNNPDAARIVAAAGALALCTDIRPGIRHEGLTVVTDDVFEPDLRLYAGADLIYAVRPGVEMVPPLIALARRIESDLLVYHLGCEIYEDGGEVLDCGPVLLHRYHRRP
ncbi:hypothetical protein F8E02_07230 [Methanoculleus sp. Wushi-C6]|uniref:UPF0146 protein F8E02_07230 n=1 Tax=Methanoculleus caldifontis TaxID=2651577 RepID=A0ABU3X1H4_9EURY|nr:UPF0146 family protein [Methanoculleus sp. Wushi-C6]MDV2481801.1 hypothetical protein [Methanoculleus sp. Wushi-C6]